MTEPSFFDSPFYKDIIDNVDVEDKLRFLDRVPSEPGLYRDQDGMPWMRTTDGRMIDRDGHFEDPKLNWVLGINEKNTWTSVN